MEKTKFSNLTNQKCKSHITKYSNKTRKTLYRWTQNKNLNKCMLYSAELNVPMIPNNSKQVVIGNTKYLLPYFVLSHKFITLCVDNADWTIEDNNSFIYSIIGLGHRVIRLVTSNKDLVDNKNNLRITGIEICLLQDAGYKLYKLQSHRNIYFLVHDSLQVSDNLKFIDKNTKKSLYLQKQ